MNTLKKIAMAALVASATLASTGLLAQPAMDMSSMKDKGMAMDMKDMKGMEMSSGEVRKIDKDAQKITLKHGEIKSMDMPGMTMVFKVLDPALLDKVKVGDKVMFNAEKRDGAIVVTAIEAVK
jgi:Cu/Ag efflux protein CusF